MENKKTNAGSWKFAAITKNNRMIRFNETGRKVAPELMEKYKVFMEKNHGWIRLPKELWQTLIFILMFNLSFAQYPTANNISEISNLKKVLLECPHKHVELFIQRNYKTAKELQKVYGIPPAIFLAQMALESKFETSRLAVESCNYFGIKGSSRYLSFKDKHTCINVYAEILQNVCYDNLNPNDIDEWLNSLVCCGYAESKQYKSKLKSIIEKYKLYLL